VKKGIMKKPRKKKPILMGKPEVHDVHTTPRSDDMFLEFNIGSEEYPAMIALRDFIKGAMVSGNVTNKTKVAVQSFEMGKIKGRPGGAVRHKEFYRVKMQITRHGTPELSEEVPAIEGVVKELEAL